MSSRARILIAVAFGPAVLLACSGDSGSGSDASSDTTSPSDVVAADHAAPGSDAKADSPGDGTVATPDADAGSVPADDGSDGAVVCTTPQYGHIWAFTSSFDGWTIATNSTATLVPGTAADGAVTGTQAALDPTTGNPAPDSVKLSIPFSQPGEQLLFAYNSPTGLNLTGTTVTAQVKLDSGLSTSPLNPGQAFIVLKSTTGYIYAPAVPTSLDATTPGWVTLTFAADAPTATIAGYTACDIREIDVVIQAGPTGTYTPAVVHIDTIAITAPGLDSGTDEAGPTPSDASPEAADALPDSTDAGSPTDATTDGG